MNNTHYYDGKWNIEFTNYKVNHDDFVKCINEINLTFNTEKVKKGIIFSFN